MIVFVDTETLGLDPDSHAVWEVGAIKYDETKNEIVATRSGQIALTEGQIAAGDPVGMDICRFHDRYDPVRATYVSKFCEEFAAFTAGAHLAGAVVSFDEERLRRLLRRWHQVPRWHYHLIDVEALAIGYLVGRGKATPVSLPWKSDDLSAVLGVTIDEELRHTALGDAQWALDMYRAVMT